MDTMLNIAQFVLIFGTFAYAVLIALALVVTPLNLGRVDRFFNWIISWWV